MLVALSLDLNLAMDGTLLLFEQMHQATKIRVLPPPLLFKVNSYQIDKFSSLVSFFAFNFNFFEIVHKKEGAKIFGKVLHNDLV